MPESTLALTFEDLITRVAEYAGVASYASDVAAAPTDTHDLDVVKRLVNDGWRRFYNSNPGWNWVNRRFTLTLDGDGDTDRIVDGENWRYYMPDGFYGNMTGNLAYAQNTASIVVVPCSVDQVLADRALSDQTGYPYEYALRPLADDPKRRWEALFYPTPGGDYVLYGSCRLYPNKLVELTDTPNCGPIFDEAVLAACLAEAERQREDGSTVMEAQWAEALTRAVAIDQKTAPRRLGNYGPGHRVPLYRPYTGVDTYTNADGTVHDFG